MTRTRWMHATLGLVMATGLVHLCWPATREHAALGDSHERVAPAEPHAQPLFSAPGLTEPRSRVVQIISEISGTLSGIHVRAGDKVCKGQLLAELNHDLQQAQVDLGRAAVDRATAELRRLENGERPEEVEVLNAQFQEARALRELADYECERMKKIRSEDAASDRELTQYRSARDQSAARERAARLRLELAQAGPRQEDLDRARAAVREAQAQLAAARSLLEKTYLRSPIDGIVVYRHREPGETVFSETPMPVLSLGDRSRLHVRVDVDEMDIGRVWRAQEVYAVASAFTGRRFHGRVVHIEPTLGRKNFRTDRPTEKIDTRVQEVVVELDDADDVPLELQMDVWFLNEPTRESAPATQGLSAPSLVGPPAPGHASPPLSHESRVAATR